MEPSFPLRQSTYEAVRERRSAVMMIAELALSKVFSASRCTPRALSASSLLYASSMLKSRLELG